MRTIITSFFILLFYTHTFGQCSCTDCTIDIISNSTQSSFLDISGATNGTLGSNGQQLCQVCVHFLHDAVQEIDFILFSPSGSSVQLIEDTGIAVNDDITFDICFVSCDQSASPDSGFPDVFDSDAGYAVGQTYDGSYYPSIGCLEDLDGDVNGTWELEMTDNIFLDDGELFDWYLVFADNTGTGCGANGSCGNPPSCLAEGGELTDPDVVACEGSSDLVVDFTPSFPNNNEPPAADFDYTYVIINTDTDVIEEINTITDLTSYEPGIYQICGLSYLIDDEPLIPDPDGSYEINDLEDDIDDEVFCADLSDECVTITIDAMVDPPDFDGPDEVCINEIYTYEILDYDPDLNYLIQIVSGSIESLDGSDGIYEIEWATGPGEICAIIESLCGDVETCIEVEVLGDPGTIEIFGEFEVCPESEETYTVSPLPVPPEFYDFTVTNGTILNQNDESVTIEWDPEEGAGVVCAELVGGLCNVDSFCQEVELIFDYELPDEINTPDIICLETPLDASIPDDPNALDYIWTLNGLTLLDGQGSNEIVYEGEFTGVGEICVEVISECAIFGPLCQDIEIIDYPEPMIVQIPPLCEFEFELEAIVDPGNDFQWTVINAPGDVEFSTDNQATTEVYVDAIGIYTFQFSENNEANCESSDIIEVEILNGPEISEPMYDCNIDMEYTVSFTILSGNAPYSVNGELITGSDFISDFIPSEEAMEFEIEDAFGCITIIEAEHECPCLSFAGTMQQDLISACAADNEPVLVIHNQDAFLDGNDIGVYILHDLDNDEIDNVLDSNSSGEFYYFNNLVYGVVYYVSYVVGNEVFNQVDLEDPCLSVSFGQPIIFYDNPEIDLLFDSQTCDQELEISGTVPPDIVSMEWSQLSGPSMIAFSNSFSIPTVLSVTEDGNYSAIINYENEACFNFEQVDFEILSSPVISNITEQCGPTGDEYTVSFEVVNSQAPFNSSYGGDFSNALFTSIPIPSGEEYQIEITDANGCVSSLLIGNKLCDCISSAGNMSPDLIEVCGTETSIQAVSLQNDSLDINDTSFYFLHTQPFNTLGTVIDSNTTGIFEFQTSMQTDVIYYISLVVGDSLPAGINLLDPCLDVASGQEVIWTSIPDVIAGEDSATCDDQIALNANASNGFWTIVNMPPNANLNITDYADPASLIEFDSVGTYELSYSVSNGNCTNSDTIRITRLESPIITDQLIKCSNDLLSFEYSFSIEGGNAPYFVNGQSSDGNFTVNMLDASIEHIFEITNIEGCTTSISAGPVLCTCTSDAGTVDTQDIILCSYEPLDVNVSNLDYTLDENDTLVYILHDGDFNSIGNIFSISTGEEIFFENGLQLNTEYILNLVVTNSENGSIGFSDPCISVSEGISVEWIPSHNLNLDERFSLCEGASVSIPVSTEGPLPVDISFTDNNGNTLNFQLENSGDEILFNAVTESAIWTITNVNGQCIETYSGIIDIEITEEVEVELVQDLEICNNPLFGSVLALSQILPPSIDGEWDASGLNIISDSIDFSGLAAGDYPVFYSTIGFNAPCPGSVFNTIISVIDCQCPTLEFDERIEICDFTNSLNLGQFNNTVYEGSWLLNNLNNYQSPPVINDMILSIEGSSEGEYELLFEILDNNYPDICQQIFTIPLFIESQNQAGIQTTVPIFCENDGTSINLADLIEEEDLNGIWTLNNQSIDPEIQISDYGPGELTFNYVIEAGDICPSDEVLANIEIMEIPQFMTDFNDISCFGFNDGSIIIQPTSGDGESYECYLNNVLQEGGKIIDNLEPGDYEVYLINEQGCQSEIISIPIQEPQPVSVSLGDDQEVEINDIVTIRAIVNIAESDIDQVTWEDLNGIIADQDLSIDQQIANNNIISISIIDENGCIAFDEIKISVSEIQIYIPNIFTPDSQSQNDQFGLSENPGVSLINEFYIYDRWGNMVFAIENIDPGDPLSYWDGYFNGAPAEQGVYVYYLNLGLVDGSSVIVVDDVTLIK